MADIFGKKKNFRKLGRVYSLDTLWFEYFEEMLYLEWWRTWDQFCVLAFWTKIQNGHHFGKFIQKWV